MQIHEMSRTRLPIHRRLDCESRSIFRPVIIYPPFRPFLVIVRGCIVEIRSAPRDRNRLRSHLSPNSAIYNQPPTQITTSAKATSPLPAFHVDIQYPNHPTKYHHKLRNPNFRSPQTLSSLSTINNYSPNFQCIDPAYLKLKCTT